MFLGIDCPCSAFCPCANECKLGKMETMPFLKELFCLHTTLFEMSKLVNEQEKRVPLLTLNETFRNALWLFRGAIEKACKNEFFMSDIQHNFSLFEKCVWTWEKTIAETESNFLKESFLPLRSQIRIHDFNEMSKNRFSEPTE